MISEKLKQKLTDARSIVFFTGAGISAESGIPTFRGEGGIWNKLKPEELANVDAFLRNPDIVWEWYQYRRKIGSEASPNGAHLAITELQKYYNVTVVTQNVDNLHRRAGANNIFELHGNIEKNYCLVCRRRFDFVDFELKEKAPRCECGGLIRPDIVWFGEMLPQGVFESSEEAASKCDILFSVGTSAVVYPAANIPFTARSYGKYVVEINLEATEMSHIYDETLRGKAGEILPHIAGIVREIKQGRE